jgi:sugar lactone lactonase YvrE
MPTDVELHPDGRLVIVDYNNYRIRALEEDRTLTTLAGNGVHGFAVPGAEAKDSPFENPIDVTFGPDGAMYIAALHEGRVLRIGDDGLVEVVAGTGYLGFSGDGGDPLAAQLSDPSGVVFADDGSLLVSDSSTARVRRIADGVIDTVVGAEDGDPEGPGTQVVLNAPQRISVAPDGRVLVADSLNNRICAWDPETGEVADVLSDGLNGPQAAIAAPDGTIFVADSMNHEIKAIDPDGTVRTVAGVGVPGSGPEKPTAPEEVHLNYPAGLLLTDEGDLYIANMLGHQVLVWRGAWSP